MTSPDLRPYHVKQHMVQRIEKYKDYRSPNTVWAVLDYDRIIAQSSLENPGEGDEWGWEG